MHISVTVLGSNGGLSPEVIGRRIADYLEGGRTRAVGGRNPGEVASLPALSGAAAYYADSAGIRPGRWTLGHTTQGRSREIDSSELATLLAGIDPRTGEPLISASGSAGRAFHQRKEPLSTVDLGRERYSVGEAAELLGISASYLRKLLRCEELAGSVNSAISVDQRGRKLLIELDRSELRKQRGEAAVGTRRSDDPLEDLVGKCGGVADRIVQHGSVEFPECFGHGLAVEKLIFQ